MFSDDSVRLQTGAITICAVNCEVLHSPSQCPQLHQGLSINCYSWYERLLGFELNWYQNFIGLYITLKEGSRIAACVKKYPIENDNLWAGR